MKNNQVIITVIVAVIVGVVAFFGGMQYQKMQRGGFAAQGTNGAGRFGNRIFGNGQNGTRPVVGQIVSVDANGITVKMNDGSTKIVVLSSTTSINKAATGTRDDLKTGENVAVFGTANSDGSVTAQSIQLNPMLRVFSGTPRPTQTQ